MHADDFRTLRPFAYHLTARSNLPGIERARRLDPAAAILRRANRGDLLRERRPDLTPVAVGDERVVIRDQAPLHSGNCDLRDGFSFADLVELLNSFVYFWPGAAAGPNAYGRRHFGRYAAIEDAVVLRIPTVDLLAANPDAVPHASAYNSGSPRCSGGRKSPRGADTFVPFPAFSHGPGKVVELTFNTPVTLPWSAVEVSTPHAWIV